jgi:hypothetical protein
MKALVAETLANSEPANYLQAGVLVVFVSIFSWLIWRTFVGPASQGYENLSKKIMND